MTLPAADFRRTRCLPTRPPRRAVQSPRSLGERSARPAAVSFGIAPPLTDARRRRSASLPHPTRRQPAPEALEAKTRWVHAKKDPVGDTTHKETHRNLQLTQVHHFACLPTLRNCSSHCRRRGTSDRHVTSTTSQLGKSTISGRQRLLEKKGNRTTSRSTTDAAAPIAHGVKARNAASAVIRAKFSTTRS